MDLNKSLDNNSNSLIDQQEGWIALGVAHILIVILPSLALGSLILSLQVANKHLRDPVSVVFGWTVVVCMVGPVSYALLMDISLITDKPLLGDCDRFSGSLYWSLFNVFHGLLIFFTALLSITQYTVIKHGTNSSLTSRRIAVIFGLLTIVAVLISSPVAVGNQVSHSRKIRGSLCSGHEDTRPLLISVLLVYLTTYVVPGILVVIFSLLSRRKVQQGVLEGNRQLVKSVTVMNILMISSVTITRLLPILSFVINVGNGNVLSVGLTNSFELNYPIYLLLTITLHKTIRENLIQKTKAIFRSSRVFPLL